MEHILGFFSNNGQVIQLFIGTSSLISLVRQATNPSKNPLWIWVSGVVTTFGLFAIQYQYDENSLTWITCSLISFGVLIGIILGKFGIKNMSVTTSESNTHKITLSTLNFELGETADPQIEYKRKLYLILKNDSNFEIIVGPSTAWTAKKARVRHLQQQVWELEPQDGWHSGNWTHKEFSELRVPAGRAFRTWIGLSDSTTKSEINQLTGELGTLIVPVKSIHKSEDISIKI